MKRIIGVSLIMFLIDQILKCIIQSSMNILESITIIPNFFNITFVKNDGAAFSILSGNRIFLIVVAFISLIMIYQFCIKDKKLNRLSVITYSLLIGGIFGNLFDRIIHGFVIDYLDFRILKYNFPIFNFADICIVIGCFLFIIITLMEEVHGKNNSNK